MGGAQHGVCALDTEAEPSMFLVGWSSVFQEWGRYNVWTKTGRVGENLSHVFPPRLTNIEIELRVICFMSWESFFSTFYNFKLFINK